MAQASGSTSQEYWRPPNPNAARLFEAPPPAELACWRCGMEYQPAARFCHMCGASREVNSRATTVPINMRGETRKSGARGLRFLLPLPAASFACFLLGVAFLVGAALLGVIYKTDTLVDWQAVQIWRVEWLLAALAALIAGLLLKKTES